MKTLKNTHTLKRNKQTNKTKKQKQNKTKRNKTKNNSNVFYLIQ